MMPTLRSNGKRRQFTKPDEELKRTQPACTIIGSRPYIGKEVLHTSKRTLIRLSHSNILKFLESGEFVKLS